MEKVLRTACMICIIACVVCLNAHAQSGTKKITVDSVNLAGEWWLQPVLPSDTATGHIPTISFNLAQKTFKGFTGCNQMIGNFHVMGSGLWFDKNITLTRISCEGFNEKDFIANLLRVNSYEIKDGVLTFSIDKNPVSRWVRRTTRETVQLIDNRQPVFKRL